MERERCQKNIGDEHGAIVLESAFAILACMIVLTFLISLGFYLYQQTMVRIVAKEIAEEISQSYKYRNLEDMTSISSSDISGVGKYRYLFFAGNFDQANNEKAKKLAKVRLAQTSLAKEEGDLSVSVKMVTDDIGRRHYEVKVSQKYGFLLGGILKMIGVQKSEQITSTAYAESVDVLNYVNTVRTTKYVMGKLKDTAVGGVVNSVIDALSSAITLLKTIFKF